MRRCSPYTLSSTYTNFPLRCLARKLHPFLLHNTLARHCVPPVLLAELLMREGGRSLVQSFMKCSCGIVLDSCRMRLGIEPGAGT